MYEIANKTSISKKKSNNKFIDMISYLSLIIFSIIIAFPFLWLILSSIKTKDEIWMFPPSLWPKVPQWNNYTEVLSGAPFGLYIFNSTFTASFIVVIQLINSAMIAYAFTQLKFKGKNLLFAIVMVTYMLPAAATYVPSYMLISKMNMLDSYKGIIISNLVNVFGIFLIRQAFMQVRKEMIEAAKIDGAGHFRILVYIMIPFCKSSFITLALLSFISNYNNYLWPSLIIKDPKHYLVTIGLRQFFIQGGAYGIKWPQVMAASAITVIPLLLLFFITQKWFMKSIGDTGLKG
ncbi:carbohydrate ABC transporter permease [Clostridium sp. DJ247]|uniref:carbohydrate ABC transporter permease n=1 Tax=Clostridium sp. DJ247 TaxID=2726188 RepID=UPI00162A5B9E|nr:carbohydrate ABC transporter permease [Clostridium sp. DJ247]MBC2579460.1 carbohydrate ABC transporter permease [Clostridium sp. DJ247]